MLPGRRSWLVAAALLAVVGVAGGFFAVRALLARGLPWGGGLAWSRMEELIGGQQIGAARVAIEVFPAEGRLTGRAELDITRPGGAGDHVVLLLNRGLDVGRVVTGDGARLATRRSHERLLIELPPEAATPVTITVPYEGRLEPGNPSTLIWSEEEILLDRLQFWYPVDLTSFTTLEVSATTPDDMEIVWGGTLQEETRSEGRRTVRWLENRPVLAAGFAAGRFERVSRVQGTVRCNVYGAGLANDAAAPLLASLGDASNYFHAQFGDDGFGMVNLVASERVGAPAHLGGALMVCPPAGAQRGEDVFATVAQLVARNWWGETVSGRWFSTRPEAGEWLLTGLSEYSAWQALRSVKGRREYLRHRESLYCPPELPGPLKAFNLGWRLEPGGGTDERLFNVRGPYVAAMLAQYVGEDAFNRACRNFMNVHRHSTVSYAALLHEMTLASERPLDELVRVWFDRPGTLDYGIATVNVEPGRVHVAIENAGDIPAYAPVELGLLSSDGYQVHRVEPGARGDTLTLPFTGELVRALLDPEFALADMHRANNVWPRTEWPARVRVAASGRIALLSQMAWGEDTAHRLLIFSPAGRAPEAGYNVAGAPAPEFQWDSAGQRLAVQFHDVGGYWRDTLWSPFADADGRFAGWTPDGPIYWARGDFHGPGRTTPPVEAELPMPADGCVALQTGTGRIAWVTEQGELLMLEPGGRAPRTLRKQARPVGGLRWRGDTAALVYMDRSGTLVSVPADGGTPTTLLHRNYPITQARTSEGGTRVAWVDPAGLLRAITPGAGEPVYISLPGEVVDFAWEGEDALVVIVADIPRRLPMRFHAAYTLWRIPATTWQGVQLPYDPVASAGAAPELELLSRP